MTISINYKNSPSKKNPSNLVLFIDEKFNISNIRKHISGPEYSFISDMLKTKSLKKKIVSFDINSKKKNNISIFKKKYF